MFSKIDQFLIIYFQWGIRQIELYTSKTRKNILDGLLSLLRYGLLFSVGAFVGLSFGQHPFTIFIYLSGAVIVLYMLRIPIVLKSASEKNLSQEEIQSEIKIRERARKLVCITSFLIFLGLFIVQTNEFKTVLRFLIFLFGFITMIEYILCTTSVSLEGKDITKKK